MHVGCLEAESGSFWDGGKASIQSFEVVSTTQVLVVDPSNPMAASHGHSRSSRRSLPARRRLRVSSLDRRRHSRGVSSR
eukprot:4241262-Prymnesium_polylepis.1